MASTLAREMTRPVGLHGEQMTTTRVRGPTAAKIRSGSKGSAASGPIATRRNAIPSTCAIFT